MATITNNAEFRAAVKKLIRKLGGGTDALKVADEIMDYTNLKADLDTGIADTDHGVELNIKD